MTLRDIIIQIDGDQEIEIRFKGYNRAHVILPNLDYLGEKALDQVITKLQDRIGNESKTSSKTGLFELISHIRLLIGDIDFFLTALRTGKILEILFFMDDEALSYSKIHLDGDIIFMFTAKGITSWRLNFYQIYGLTIELLLGSWLETASSIQWVSRNVSLWLRRLNLATIVLNIAFLLRLTFDPQTLPFTTLVLFASTILASLFNIAVKYFLRRKLLSYF